MKRSLFIFLTIALSIAWGTLHLQTESDTSEYIPTPAELTIELNNTQGTYLGFGIGIHPGDVIYPEAFNELDLEFVRMELGPLWYAVPEKIPAGASVTQLKTFIAENYNGDSPLRLEGAHNAYQFLRQRGIQIILIHFEVPYHWRASDGSGQLLPEHVEDFARFLTAHLSFLKDQGIQIDYIELANEPDGIWNGHIPPTEYTRLLKLTNRLFEEAALSVDILGPGLAFLNLYGKTPEYLAAFDAEAVEALDGWSTHTWDEVEFPSARPEYSYGVWQPFLDGIEQVDPDSQKPLFVTEYGSDVLKVQDTHYASPRIQITDTVVDSWPYAVRVMANSISHLNRGANALILYRLSNAHWHKTGWGIIQPQSKSEFTRKPAYHAIAQFISDLPLQSEVLRPSWHQHDAPITLSVFKDHHSQQLCLLFVNASASTQEQSFQLSEGSIQTIIASIGLNQSGSFTPRVNLQQNEVDTLSIEIPAESIARITLAYR